MNKNQLKQFAMESRNTLRSSIENKLNKMGIKDEKNIIEPQVTGDKVFINEIPYNKKQYDALMGRFKEVGYDQLVESMAYTWFNRFIALRFMEQNGYIDEKIVESTTSKVEADIVDEYRNADFYSELKQEQKDELIELKDQDRVEELYSKLVVYKCNELSSIFPFMFEKLGDYTELLFPEGLIHKGSFLEKIRESIKKDKENGENPIDIEIIGWLYQFYNAEKKDEVFAGLNKNIKLNKNTIPAATQLFTPKWIVAYMIENSLGKLILETSDKLKKEKIEDIKEKWKYFIENEKEIEINEEEKDLLNIENIKLIDPAMGSGHILIYAFDFLYGIYEKLGYSDRDSIKYILENNLYGLEIDDRAAQLASFAVFMKAREKYRRLFKYLLREHIELNTCAIQESNPILNNKFNLQTIEIEKLEELKRLIYTFEDAKELGSIINFDKFDIEKLNSEFKVFVEKSGQALEDRDKERIRDLIKQAEIMQSKYDVVVTNPPYMGGKGMGAKLGDYVKKNYKDSKSDMFAVFMEKCMDSYTKKNGYTAMITMHSWMFLSSFEKLRVNLIENREIDSLVHLGARAFEEIGGEVVQTVAWVMKNGK